MVSTNALELGIDIGRLDVCVMAGYAGTVASTWQQAGRAGRRQNLSAVVLVASSSPADQYIINNPDYFFGRSPEHATIDADNLVILMSHLKCASFELPFEAEERPGAGRDEHPVARDRGRGEDSAAGVELPERLEPLDGRFARERRKNDG